MPVTVTLNQIKFHSPCREGWLLVLRSRGDNPDYDEPFPLANIIDSNCLSHAVWAMRCHPNLLLAQRFALGCAEMARHLMRDTRSTDALDAAARYLLGEATREEVDAAARWSADAAADAAARWSADAAADAARWSADAARWSADAARRSVTADAADAARWSAAVAADAAAAVAAAVTADADAARWSADAADAADAAATILARQEALLREILA